MMSLEQIKAANNNPDQFMRQLNPTTTILVADDFILFDDNLIDLFKEVNKHNEYESESELLSLDCKEQSIYLFLNGKQLTSGDTVEVLKRVKQINHEKGLSYF
jgi:hypothetical protein